MIMDHQLTTGLISKLRKNLKVKSDLVAAEILVAASKQFDT